MESLQRGVSCLRSSSRRSLANSRSHCKSEGCVCVCVAPPGLWTPAALRVSLHNGATLPRRLISNFFPSLLVRDNRHWSVDASPPPLYLAGGDPRAKVPGSFCVIFTCNRRSFSFSLWIYPQSRKPRPPGSGRRCFLVFMVSS